MDVIVLIEATRETLFEAGGPQLPGFVEELKHGVMVRWW